MEQLDLKCHTPEEFAGKTVSISARNYTIGPKFEGDEGHAHFLINDVSGLCLHVIQIGKEYMTNPSAALAASRTRERETAALRTNMQRNGQQITLPFISVIEANGGSFELHETTWGAFGHRQDSPGREVIDLAVSQSEAGDQRSAIAVLTALLQNHPNHSIALGLLAGVYCDSDDQVSARSVFARSIEIEPNYAKCLGQQIIVTQRGIHRRQALDLFQELKARYPLLDDYDGVGISAHLMCGEPQQALQLLQKNTLPSQDADQLLTQINCALEVKQLLAKLGEGMVQGQIGEADLLGYLEDLYKAYPLDPLIQANLGCALYRSGQYQRACELLDSAGEGIADELLMCFCAVNLAFAFIGIGAWEPGLEILSDIMSAMSETAKSNFTKNPINTPGLVDWFAEKGVLRSRRNSNYQVLAAAMATCPDQALITAPIRQLAELYRRADASREPAVVAGAAAVSRTAADPAVPAPPAATSNTSTASTPAPPAEIAVATQAPQAAPISNELPVAAPHVGHSATLLSNGKVLIAGGSAGTDALYDPACGTSAPAGSLATSRARHTATLLPGGQVLVVGGSGGGCELSSAELYDSTGNLWSAAGSLESPREFHSATLLPNGKVLVAGGTGRGRIVSTAELYDPSSNTWSPAGKLLKGRYRHSASLLPSGKVLVAGGFGGSPYLASAELYDPASNTWSEAASLATARQGHTATLLASGKLLVVGGENRRPNFVANAELYDPTSNIWSAAGNLAVPRNLHTGTLLPGDKVLVAGGHGVRGSLASCELYDPSSNTWSSVASLSAPREEHTATLLLGGKVLVMGGRNGSGFVCSDERYDPLSSTWSTRAA